MSNPLVVFARPDGPHKNDWRNLEIAAFDTEGRRLASEFESGTLIVMKDTIPSNEMPTRFHETHPVLWVEHGNKPPNSDQIGVIQRWPNAQWAGKFSHFDGNEIYENLRVILHADGNTQEIASAIERLKNGRSADGQLMVVNNVAMLEQTRILDPGANLEAWEAEIRTTELGGYLLKQKKAAGGIEAAIADEVERLSRSQA